MKEKLAGKGEWCRLDSVEDGPFQYRRNLRRATDQTCLGAANKNLFASALSAREKGRYDDYKERKEALEKVWKEKKEATRKFAAEYKKKLVNEENMRKAQEEAKRQNKWLTYAPDAGKVQAQAHAFAEKQNNEEFFNAEEGNNNDIFYNADGGRRRRRTRRKRGRGGISSKKKSAKKTGKTRASQTMRSTEIEQRRLEERTQTALDFGFLPGFKSKTWDKFKTEGIEDGIPRRMDGKKRAISKKGGHRRRKRRKRRRRRKTRKKRN